MAFPSKEKHQISRHMLTHRLTVTAPTDRHHHHSSRSASREKINLNNPLNQGGGHGHSGGSNGGEPPRARPAGRRVLLRVLPLVGGRRVVGGRAGRVRDVPRAVAARPRGRPGRVGRGRGRRRGGLRGLEQLHGLQHGVHRVDGDGVPVVDRGPHPRGGVGGLRPDAHLVAHVLHREVVAPGSTVGGERVHGPVVGLEAPQRVVHGHRVEQQQRRLPVGAQVPVARHEGPEGVVGGAERRHAALHGRLERRERVGGLGHQGRERLAPALGHERRDVRRRRGRLRLRRGGGRRRLAAATGGGAGGQGEEDGDEQERRGGGEGGAAHCGERARGSEWDEWQQQPTLQQTSGVVMRASERVTLFAQLSLWWRCPWASVVIPRIAIPAALDFVSGTGGEVDPIPNPGARSAASHRCRTAALPLRSAPLAHWHLLALVVVVAHRHRHLRAVPTNCPVGGLTPDGGRMIDRRVALIWEEWGFARTAPRSRWISPGDADSRAP
uniref:Uncharacterized protein n=1 Tax=Setaria italica TaxID=4555 RepID=K3YHA3_SETIT